MGIRQADVFVSELTRKISQKHSFECAPAAVPYDNSDGESESIGISLPPAEWYPPLGFAPTRNASQHGKLSQFASSEFYPDIALLAFPINGKDIQKSLAKLETNA